MTKFKRNVITTERAPKAIGPYSAGISTETMIFASGSLGLDPATGEFVPGGIEAQTRQALKNLEQVLLAGGASLATVVKTTVFMQDLTEFGKMNAVYAAFFPDDPPARSAVQVAALPKGAAVEIEAIALSSS
jgi:2-iminobutanoate/2-iminopropanoate deaminase